MDENRIKHLEFVQGVITRMAQNSLMMKGWSVTLIAALLATAEPGQRGQAAKLALVPCVAFWLLDVYYLWLEVSFRNRYTAVLGSESAAFSMKPIMTFKDLVWSIFSPSVVMLHVPLLVTILHLGGLLG